MTPPELQVKRRLLFLLPFAPRINATHGGARVIAQLVTELAVRHHVALLYLRAAHEPPIDDTTRSRCDLVEEIVLPSRERSTIQQHVHRLRVWAGVLGGKPLWAIDRAVAAYGDRLRELAQAWHPDIIQIEFHIMAQYLEVLNGCSAPRVLTLHEPGAQAVHDQWVARQRPGRVLPHLDMLAWKRFERTIIRSVQAVVVFTERDRQAIARYGQPTPIIQIPFGTVLPQQPLDPLGSSPPNLLFVGNFSHMPNVDAATRLISRIFPRVKAHYPESRLYIVGSQPPPQIQQVANEHVVVTGWVPDVTSYLNHAALVVVPLFLGGGMRVKVLEALAAGKAVVASPRAVEGLDLVDGEHVILAESDEQFCDAIKQLLAEPQQRVALGVCARAWACANLGWQQSIAAYENLYQRLLNGSA